MRMNKITERTGGFQLPWFLLTLSISFTINCALSEQQNCTMSPNVRILQGNLRGEIVKTWLNREVYSFRGIPYAKPPIGHLRFEKPEAARPWNRTLFATTDSNVCPQLSNGVFTGNEDCLYLNVYTPQLSVGEEFQSLPVMVFIHGGGFRRGNGGSTLYGPQFILDKDVVLVTLNYRLGPLGFLSTGDGVVPGNNGLKDQVLALKWVQQNIRHFGGDPQRVTIFGQSVGGCSTHLLALSNSTIGLFHRYISQSGSALSIRGYRPSYIYKNRAFELGRYLDCPTTTSELLVSCLKNINVTKIIETNEMFYEWRNFPDIFWGPTDEPRIDGAFLTDSPYDLYATGRIRDMPWMTGDVENSGLLLDGDFHPVNSDAFDDFLANFDEALPHVLQYDRYLENVKARTDALKSYYFNNDLSADKSVLLANFTQMLSDSFFTFPIYNGLQKQLPLTKSEKYFYSFEYRGTSSHSYSFTNGSTSDYGAVHNDELLYLFPTKEGKLASPETEMSENDLKMMQSMVQLWTSFAIDGIPTASALDGNSTWLPYSQLDNYLRIGRHPDVKLSIQYSFLRQRMQFWKELTSQGTTTK